METSVQLEPQTTIDWFRIIVEAAPNAMVMVDSSGCIQLVNRGTEQLFGYSRAELLGRDVAMLIPEPFSQSHPRYVESYVAKPELRTIGADRELFGRRKDGVEVPIEIGLSPISTPLGTFVLASIIDITQQRRTVDLFRKIVDSAPYAKVVVDAAGTITLVNRSAELLFDYRRDELIGRPIETLLPPRLLVPQSREVQAWATRSDGSMVPIELGCREIETLDTKVMLVSMLDMSASVQAEERSRMVVDAAPNAILQIDWQHRITLVNRKTEELFGYTRAELIGQPVEQLVPAALRERHRAQVDSYLTTPTARAMGAGRELFGRHKDGTEIPIEIGLNPIVTVEGTYILASIIDLRHHKRIEQELLRSNAELEQFAYIASHDLQEPLRMVASYTELLGERYRGALDERADKYIGYAVEGAKRMQRLVSDLLAYSRIGSQGKPFAQVAVLPIVETVLKLFASQIRSERAVVEVGALPVVLADPVQLQQVFQNLLSNALKFHGARPPMIRLSAEECDDRWLFAVADNGIGIEPKYADRVFQMFQRLHERGRFDGSGIGLTITKRIVERHGGRIWLESVPGQGTTFYFTLPRAAETVGAER